TTFHFSRALELRRTDTRTRCKLASVLAEAGMREDAVTQFKLLATLHLERSEPEAAAEAYQRVVELVPQDVSVRERLFTLYCDSHNLVEAHRAGDALGALYMDLGLHDKAQQLYRQLLK